MALHLPPMTAHSVFFTRCQMRLNPRALRVYTTAVLLACALASPAVAGDLSKIRIDNFGRVNDSYFRGAQPEGRDYTDLASLGVKTLVDLTSDEDADNNERVLAEHAGMQYVHLPMTTHEPPSAPRLADFLSIVNNPAKQPVYVHCVGGRHRTGMMTAAHRMSNDGWTADQAFKEMKQYKYGADFLHSEFKEFVYGYRPERA